MEHTQNTRKVLAAGLVLAAAAGLAGCATASPAAETISHRMLVRESADRYVDQLVGRAHAAVTHRMLVRESADRYVDQLIERAASAELSPSAADDLSPLAPR